MPTNQAIASLLDTVTKMKFKLTAGLMSTIVALHIAKPALSSTEIVGQVGHSLSTSLTGESIQVQVGANGGVVVEGAITTDELPAASVVTADILVSEVFRLVG
jgi:hypothetical protein